MLTWSEDRSQEHLVSHFASELCVLVFVDPFHLNDFLRLCLLSFSLAIVGSLAVRCERVGVTQANAIMRDVRFLLSHKL